MNENNNISKLLPIMVTFFCMGFVDMVGTATNYVQKDLLLDDAAANVFPSMVFFWFLIFSVPTGVLMNRIGRRKTVLISLVVTIISLIIPILPFMEYNYTIMLVSFSLLGIGNTLMQVSLNPLLSTIVKGDKLASSLTLGQFVKAIASFIAPIIAAQAAIRFDNWKLLFPIFMVIAVLATILLGLTHIEEQKEDMQGTSIKGCFKLLGNSTIFLFFLGIMCHVGIDVGTNVTAPRILMERLDLSELNNASYAISVYFFFRTIGCFTGTFVLARYSAQRFFLISVILIAVGVGGLFFFTTEFALCACIGLIGLGNSNVFSVILSKALLYMPNKKNEISGLMMMGIFGGTIFPFLMGLATNAISSQAGALLIMSIGAVYLLFLSFKMDKN